MAHFFNPDNSDEVYGSLTLPAGQSKEVVLWGGGPNGEALFITSTNDLVVEIQGKQGRGQQYEEVVHVHRHTRRFTLRARKEPGRQASIEARLGEDGPVWAVMNVKVVPPAVSPGIAGVSYGDFLKKYVDFFTECRYDVNYKVPPDASFYFSPILQLKYADGTPLELDIEKDLSDIYLYPDAARDAMAHGYVGRNGRLFPKVLMFRTTPRLWRARAAALEVQDRALKKFVDVARVGMTFILMIPMITPLGAIEEAGVLSTPITETPVPGAARAAGAAEAAVSIRPRATPQLLRQMMDSGEYYVWGTPKADVVANQTIRFTGENTPAGAPEGVYFSKLGKGGPGVNYGDNMVAIKYSPKYQLRLTGDALEFRLDGEIPANEGIWFTKDDLAAARAGK
jgi:hypothetical protein